MSRALRNPGIGVRLTAGLWLLAAGGAHAATKASAEPTYRLLFTGDVLLAREVAHEINARHGASPWAGMHEVFKGADLVMGNLEGAVGDIRGCLAPAELCFADDPKLLTLAKEAGFTVMSLANNHSGDLGEAGREETRSAVTAAGMVPLDAGRSPAFVRLGGRTVALVALSLVPNREGQVDAVPSWRIGQKLRLAHALADWTVVFVHWGKELADWVVPQQHTQAQWLVTHGADVVIGAHPHVVQPAECVNGRPVFFSLGNHVFDQKYRETKHGLIADCRIAGGQLACAGIATETPMGSSFPRPGGVADTGALAGCPVAASQPITGNGWTLRAWTPQREVRAGQTVLQGMQGLSTENQWRTRPGSLLGAEFGELDEGQPPLLFTLERHRSSMDEENGTRPYVYEMTSHGLVARWRGSALAWPLLDARLMQGQEGRTYLCALHRGDSFLVPDPAHPAPPHVLVYAWNGFGFMGQNEPALMDNCRRLYAEALAQ